MNLLNKSCEYMNPKICSDIREYQKGKKSPRFEELLDKYVDICTQGGQNCLLKKSYEKLKILKAGNQ